MLHWTCARGTSEPGKNRNTRHLFHKNRQKTVVTEKHMRCCTGTSTTCSKEPEPEDGADCTGTSTTCSIFLPTIRRRREIFEHAHEEDMELQRAPPQPEPESPRRQRTKPPQFAAEHGAKQRPPQPARAPESRRLVQRSTARSSQEVRAESRP